MMMLVTMWDATKDFFIIVSIATVLLAFFAMFYGDWH